MASNLSAYEKVAKEKRVVLITEIIAPYRIPLFNHMAKHYANFTVLFLKKSNYQREWKVEEDNIAFDYHVLSGGYIPTKHGSPLYINHGVKKLLAALKPDVIVCGGYNHTAFLSALMYAKIHKVEYILWVESTLQDNRMKSSLKSYFKKKLIEQADRFVVPGTASKTYLTSFDVPERLIWVAPNSIDNHHFSTVAVHGSLESVSVETVMVCVSRLVEHKGVMDLLQAVYRLQNHSIELHIIGSGPDTALLKTFIDMHQMKNVTLHGFLQQDELPRMLGRADIFVLPTRSDPWGLVVNEAMSTGLPVIVSDKAGCEKDMVIDGYNGFRFKAGNIESLMRAIQRYVESSVEQKMKLKVHALEHIAFFMPELTAQGFEEAVYKRPNTVWHIFNDHKKTLTLTLDVDYESCD